MTDQPPGPRMLRKGENLPLADLGAELGGLTVYLDSRGADGDIIDADVGVLLCDGSGKARSSNDLVFYNQPIALDGAVHLRDKVRIDPEGEKGEIGWSSDVVTIELDDIPEEVQRIVVSASLDPSTSTTFGAAAVLRMRLQRTSDATDLLVFDITDTDEELALVFGEFYRRDGSWRIRAVGQGYADGLAGLATAYGIEVAAEPDDHTADDAEPVRLESDHGDPPIEEALPPEPGEVTAPPVDPADLPADVTQPQRTLSVRRPTRAPRMPADWNASIPAADGNDWQPARLFPVAGIGAGEEQERRATSALLAVMSMVREFGSALVSRCGGPRGTLTTYIEVPFGQDEEAYRPDGVIQVTRGQRPGPHSSRSRRRPQGWTRHRSTTTWRSLEPADTTPW